MQVFIVRDVTDFDISMSSCCEIDELTLT